ncbi:MAG TPA: thioesterase family protein [Candidatus Limnocylindria bacterium]|nr:thioesterase family protein [Candidatus Limnocylindria bacterium]
MSDDFRHRTRIEVRFRDIDSFGHVNNAVIASYVEQARVRYLRDVVDVDPIGKMPLILGMLKIDYLSPVFLQDEVEVGSRVDWIGNSSISMSHLLRAADRELARSTSILVAYDYANARPMPVPDAWRQAFASQEGRSLERPRGEA